MVFTVGGALISSSGSDGETQRDEVIARRAGQAGAERRAAPGSRCSGWQGGCGCIDDSVRPGVYPTGLFCRCGPAVGRGLRAGAGADLHISCKLYNLYRQAICSELGPCLLRCHSEQSLGCKVKGVSQTWGAKA